MQFIILLLSLENILFIFTSKKRVYMRTIFLIFLLAVSVSFSQNKDVYNLDKRFTNGAENGYSWWEYAKTSHTVEDYRYNFLAAMLDYHRGRKQMGLKPKFPIDCSDDIYILSEAGKGEEIDLHAMVRLIDKFYSYQDNLVIPILGAYCYCVKSLTEISDEQLEDYRQELLKFSLNKSEQ